MTSSDFESVTMRIVRRLRGRRSSTSQRSIWTSIVSEFADHGSCDATLIDVVEDEIRVHLQGMRVAALRATWTGSALGLTDPDDVDLIPASELRRFLAPELLARITELAAAEAAGDDRSAETQQAAPADAPKTADR